MEPMAPSVCWRNCLSWQVDGDAISSAARFFGIPEKTAEGWYYAHLEPIRRCSSESRSDPSAGAVAGDRRIMSLSRDIRQFCCVLIDHTNGSGAATCWKAGINRRCCDIAGVRESNRGCFRSNWRDGSDLRHVGRLPQRGQGSLWHIDPHYRRSLPRDELFSGPAHRSQMADVQAGIFDERSKEELKGEAAGCGLTNPENLTKEQHAELDKLKRAFPLLGKLADHRELAFADESSTTIRITLQPRRGWTN